MRGTLSVSLIVLLLTSLSLVFTSRAEGPIDWDKAREFWAFQAPVKSAPPTVGLAGWPQNDLDRFVLAKIEAANLTPAAAANRTTLIRRLSYDLTGIPPAPDAVERFVQDPASDAYHHLVEELLGSDQFGERLASMWLNVARWRLIKRISSKSSNGLDKAILRRRS